MMNGNSTPKKCGVKEKKTRVLNSTLKSRTHNFDEQGGNGGLLNGRNLANSLTEVCTIPSFYISNLRDFK